MKLYRLYIDESGDHTYYETEDPAKTHLGLTGILIEYEYSYIASLSANGVPSSIYPSLIAIHLYIIT